MTKNRREILKGAAAIGGAAMFAPAVLAQSQFPSRNVRVVVPFPAGATTDMLARLISQRLSETMGQPFVVENVGGGGGSIGADQVAKATADGHTLLFGNITFSTTTSSLMYIKRARHTFDDFVTVSVGAWVPLLFLAAKDVPVEQPQGIRRLRQESTTSRCSTARPVRAASCICAARCSNATPASRWTTSRSAARRRWSPICWRAASSSAATSCRARLQHVRSGSLKAMAVATKSAALPNVPTAREMGFPNLELQGWNGFLAPKGTPDAIVNRIQQQVAEAVKRPDIAKRMTDVGAEPSGNTPAEMDKMLKAQIAQVRPVVEELKLVVE